MLTAFWRRISSKNLFFNDSRLIGVCLLTSKVETDGLAIADVAGSDHRLARAFIGKGLVRSERLFGNDRAIQRSNGFFLLLMNEKSVSSQMPKIDDTLDPFERWWNHRVPPSAAKEIARTAWIAARKKPAIRRQRKKKSKLDSTYLPLWIWSPKKQRFLISKNC